MAIPADNPMSREKVALGRQLFFDERLILYGSRSCYSCHVCEHGLTDGLPKAIGAANKQLTRSSPTLWNIGYHKEFYWDGRSPSLEKQAMAARLTTSSRRSTPCKVTRRSLKTYFRATRPRTT